MILYWRRYGKAGGCQIYGGVAQLGEHLPCKQGVKGSNPSISIRWRKLPYMYLENFILNDTINNNLTVRSSLRREWKTRKTSEVKTLRKQHNYLNPLKKTILQQTTNPHVTLYMRAKWEHKVAKNYKLIFSVTQVQALTFWLSYKERRVDALALRADERRDKLR